jgi:hypothetical protein
VVLADVVLTEPNDRVGPASDVFRFAPGVDARKPFVMLVYSDLPEDPDPSSKGVGLP